MRRALKTLSLGLLGALLGTGAAFFSSSYPPFERFSILISRVFDTHEPDRYAYACVPETESEEIFYISCGGIY